MSLRKCAGRELIPNAACANDTHDWVLQLHGRAALLLEGLQAIRGDSSSRNCPNSTTLCKSLSGSPVFDDRAR